MRLWLVLLLSSHARAAQVHRAPVPVFAAPAAAGAAVRLPSSPLHILPLSFPMLPSPLPILPSAAVPAPAPEPSALAELSQGAEAAAGPAEPKTPAEQAAALSAVAFDGLGSASQEALPGPDEPQLPSSLSVADPEHKTWVAAIIHEASRSRTGRRVLKQVARMAERRGRPVIIIVDSLRANNGEYVYDWEVVRLASSYRSRPAGAAAHTLIHELLHVVQKDLGLPADALEMEIEAHIVGLKVMRELGLKPEKGSFEMLAERHFKRDSPSDFAAWLGKEYATNIPLAGGIDAYIAELSRRLEKGVRRLAPLEKKLKMAQATLENMVKTGQPSEMIEAYRIDEVVALESSLRTRGAELGWVKRDLELLASEAGKARAAAFARRVRAWLRRAKQTYGD